MKKAAKIFIVIGIILGFPLIIPLVEGIIALKKIDTATCKADIKITAIHTLLLCNIVGGILMFCLSEEDLLENCVFWYCDGCGACLNVQEGFDQNASKHICNDCGFENDTTEDNIIRVCSDCGTQLSESDKKRCPSCQKELQKKTNKRLAVAGAVVAGAAAVVGVAAVATKSALDGIDTDNICSLDEDEDADVLLEENYPRCKTCGSEMTTFDGWAWYTCPECEDKVRIIDGKETWRDEIFSNGKKQHKSDFSLVDFCQGGALTDD